MAGGKQSPSPVTWGQHLREESEHFCRTSKVSISLIRWAFCVSCIPLRIRGERRQSSFLERDDQHFPIRQSVKSEHSRQVKGWGLGVSDKEPFAQAHEEGYSQTGITKTKGTGAEQNDAEVGTDQPYGLAGED